MKLCALASGSSGNCFYAENNGKAVLIDAGISSKQIAERLHIIGKSPEKIDAIFLTHEHSDHIKGVEVFSRKFQIPVFATKKTFENSSLVLDRELFGIIRNNEVVDLNGLKIEAFSKSHKAADPVSYNLSNGKKISIITDIGYCCKNVIENISDSDLLCIESNYDDFMLENGHYPYFLKQWIKSEIGHLSNKESSLTVLENASSKLRHIVLSHLSKNNNTPLQALSSFAILKERSDIFSKIHVSHREIPTKLIEI